jgi:hypothetical protein
LSARYRSWSLALAVAVVIGAAACQTDDLFTPLGTVGYTASGGLVSQAAETQGNQIMTWIFDDATIDVGGQGSFAYLEPGPCRYVQNTAFLLGFSAFCGVEGYTFSEGTYPSTIKATVSEIRIRRACRPALPDGGDYEPDGVLNENDNCQLVYNPDQENTHTPDDPMEFDYGDACSLPDIDGNLSIPDRDGDRIADFADNCLWLKNVDQADSEPDPFLFGIGDVCEREAFVDLGRPPATFDIPVDISSRGAARTSAVIEFDSNPAAVAPAVVCTPNFVDCEPRSQLMNCVLIEQNVSASAN